jgi:hypothetical protein
MLKAQDIVLSLELALAGPLASYHRLGEALGLSASQAHASVKRCLKAALLSPATNSRGFAANIENLLEFLVHGVRFVFPAERGALTRGMPTAHAAPPLKDRIRSEGPAPVWPHPAGKVQGEALLPLHKSGLTIAEKNPKVYQALALVDAIRGGRARERKLAAELLTELLRKEAQFG